MAEFGGCIQDVDGEVSSKRVVAIIAFAAYLLGGLAQTMGAPVPATFMDGLFQILMGGLVLVVAERFAPQRKPE